MITADCNPLMCINAVASAYVFQRESIWWGQLDSADSLEISLA